VKPAPFAYYRAADTEEAASLLSELGDDAKILAGGQSLIPLLALRLTRFDHLVDISRTADLRQIDVDGTEVRVGAAVLQTEILRSLDVAAAQPLLPLASKHVGHFQIRNRGTIGGSIAHADPAAEYPAVAVLLDAHLELSSAKGSRSVNASDFFRSTFETAAEPEELLTGVRFPIWTGRTGFAVEEAARRSGDFAIAGAMAGIALDDDGVICQAAVAFFGVGSTPVKATPAESALVGQPAAGLSDSVIDEIGRSATGGLDPPGDLHGSSQYRRHLAGVMAARAIARSLASAQSAGSS
jgi:aerobic carbon-monoxide dehydrogenase medium subunit